MFSKTKYYLLRFFYSKTSIGAKHEVQEEVHFIHPEEPKMKACLVFPNLMASTRPLAFVSPFHLTQKSLDCLNGQSSAMTSASTGFLRFEIMAEKIKSQHLKSQLFLQNSEE